LFAEDTTESEMDETEALKLMSEEMEKPKKERNKALILKAQRISFKTGESFCQLFVMEI